MSVSHASQHELYVCFYRTPISSTTYVASTQHPVADTQYTNNQQLHFNVYDVLYSQLSYQRVLLFITTIFRVMWIVNKIHQKHWSAFVGYLYVMGLINAQKMEHVKIINVQ